LACRRQQAFCFGKFQIETDYILKSSAPERVLGCEGFHYTEPLFPEYSLMSHQFKFDVVIIGSGAAGLAAALQLPTSLDIAILAKAELEQTSSYWAQGGISAVLDPNDSVDLHVRDTIETGAGICDQQVVEFTVANSTECINWLADLGMPFTLDNPELVDSAFHLTREGGHSMRRVVHVADTTGTAMQQTLQAHVAERANIRILQDHIAIDLISKEQECVGLYAYNRGNQHVDVFRAQKVILATGGPDGSTGDGIAMAWRAGCRVANMEFNQFHPTCLYHPEARTFLITEAVRGEGGKLLLPDGSRFMPRFDNLPLSSRSAYLPNHRGGTWRGWQVVIARWQSFHAAFR
jgi:L-aspartate oxidase